MQTFQNLPRLNPTVFPRFPRPPAAPLPRCFGTVLAGAGVGCWRQCVFNLSACAALPPVKVKHEKLGLCADKTASAAPAKCTAHTV